MTDDPHIHTFETDCLPTEHRWSTCTVLCGCCGQMVHAFNNECMQEWVEWGDSVLCWTCALQTFQSSGFIYADFAQVASHHPSVER